MSRAALTYFEIDVPYCSRTYGVAPCTASVGTAEQVAAGEATGTEKCFNCRTSCQDPENYDEIEVTKRYRGRGDYYPAEIEASASIADFEYSPAVISLGEGLGQRAHVAVTFDDGLHNNIGPGGDKYWSERPYWPEAEKQGTEWGKFRARYPSVRGFKCRLIQGFLGQSFEEMDRRHFFGEASEGPTGGRASTFSITAKDGLKIADDERAQGPAPSEGFLLGDISAVQTSFTIGPAGIGSDYALSGKINVSGNEAMSFTRDGDVFTVGRGADGTAAVVHEGGDRVQQILAYATSVKPSVFVDDVLASAGAAPETRDLAAWNAESDTYANFLISPYYPEPTGVRTQLEHAIQQAGLMLWWNTRHERFEFRVLRPISPNAYVFDASNIIAGSFKRTEQPGKLITRTWTYFGARNRLKKFDDRENYRASRLTPDLQAEKIYGGASLKTTFANLIPAFAGGVAEQLNAIKLGRYGRPPRHFKFRLHREPGGFEPQEGAGYRLRWATEQHFGGQLEDIPVVVVRLKPDGGEWDVDVEEARFTALNIADQAKIISVDSHEFNFNWRTAYDQVYPPPEAGEDVFCIVRPNVTVGSLSTLLPAFDVGPWSESPNLHLINQGLIQGKGAVGGRGRGSWGAAHPGSPGGNALKTEVPISLTDAAGKLWSGGGGGGGGGGNGAFTGGGGGGGAGTEPGAGGPATAAPGSVGTENSGGPGGIRGGRNGGAGGGPGLPGAAGVSGGGSGVINTGTGGAPGAAIDGFSLVTTIGSPGDRRGPTIN